MIFESLPYTSATVCFLSVNVSLNLVRMSLFKIISEKNLIGRIDVIPFEITQCTKTEL